MSETTSAATLSAKSQGLVPTVSRAPLQAQQAASAQPLLQCQQLPPELQPPQPQPEPELAELQPPH